MPADSRDGFCIFVSEMKPVVTIVYCAKCNWLLRAAYFAQELLTTFTDDLDGVTLRPAERSGDFRISVNEIPIFDRREYGGFADIKEIKQLVRDLVNPQKNLGHSEKK
jgi:selenoprotein W-related protein